MKWTIAVAFGALLIASNVIVRQFNNNICKTFQDYYSHRDSNENCYHNPEHELTVPKIITRRGYPLETHKVKTQDGYVLTIFRIPAKGSNKTTSKPVFLQHGFSSSSSNFIGIGEKSLGFLLADRGYDVWLGNFRGSTYSRDHVRLNETDSNYWNFSLHEHGMYDLPAQLEHVYRVTRQKINYIGYSLGTTTMFMYASTYAEDAKERINVFVNLAPSAYLRQINSLIKYPMQVWFIVQPLAQLITNGKLYARMNIPQEIIKWFCLPHPFQLRFCNFLDMLVFGISFDQADPETLPVTYFQHADWTSVTAFSHLVQQYTSGNFQRYDYGHETNKKIYKQPQPPHYNLTNMADIPSYFIRAENDLVTTKENVERLYNALPPQSKPRHVYVVKDENFNHLDFVGGKDVVPLLYEHVLDIISKY